MSSDAPHDLDDIDGILAVARKTLSDNPYCPPSFPSNAGERRDIAAKLKIDGEAIGKLIGAVVVAISLEKDALAQPYFFHIDPVQPSLAELVFQDSSCYRFARSEEVREVVESASELWKAALSGRRMEAIFPHRWPLISDVLVDAAKDLRKVPKQSREFLRDWASKPADYRKAVWSLVGQRLIRHGALDGLRKFLRVLRSLSQMSEGIAGRMAAIDAVPANTIADPENKPKPNGPFPPNGFRHEGKESFVPRPLVWRLISALWAAKNWTLRFDELADAVWRDHEKLIDESTLGSVRRDANKFFTKNSIPITISTRDGFCSMTPI